MTIKDLYSTSRPSLDLNFALTKRLDPRITFSRASTGTYFDANGVLQTAATNVARFDHNPSTGESLGLLMEETGTNLLQYSTTLKGGLWVNTAGSPVAVVPNSALAPDNTFTASKVVEGNTTDIQRWSYNNLFSTATGWSGTFFAKAAERSNISLRMGFGGASIQARFDLGSQTATYTGNENYTAQTTQRITALPNGWYKCEIFTTGNIGGNSVGYELYITDSSGNISYAGDGVSGIYVWGAQLEQSFFPTSYIKSNDTFTSRASTATYYNASGVIQTAGIDVARSAAYFPDSNGIMKPAGLLLEAAGTNLLNGSQTFATSGGTQNNWVDTNITRDGTLRTSPGGTANALRVTAAAANATLISSAAIGTSAQRTFSIFLRRVTGTGNIDYTLDNGATWTTQVITTSWRRYSFPATTADQQVGIRIATSGDAIELWGAQLEASSYSTSYVATTTATVTRSADVSSSATVTRSSDLAQMTGTNFSSWYVPDKGTIFCSGDVIGEKNNTLGSTFASLGTTDNNTFMNFMTYDNRLTVGFLTPSLANASNFDDLTGVKLKMATGFGDVLTSNTSACSAINGTIYNQNLGGNYSVTGTPATFGGYDRFGIGRAVRSVTYHNPINGHISRLTYYPTRLTDAQLQALTAS